MCEDSATFNQALSEGEGLVPSPPEGERVG